MDSGIREKVVACLRRTGAEFEAVAPGRAEEFSGHVSQAYSGLLAAGRRLPEPHVGAGGATLVDRYSLTWHMLWGSVGSMTAAWTLLERGYPTEPLAVARHAMEKVACAIVLFDNPSLVQGFVAGMLGAAFPGRCIGPVSRVVREFAHAHGTLNQIALRVAPEAVIVPMVPEGGPELPSGLAVGGDLACEPPGRAHWTELADLFCEIARDILKPAAANVFFRTRRTAVLEE